MNEIKPRFTGIFIPAEILEIEELTLLDQLLISWIDALYCKERGGCFAKNEYLAAKLRVKENTIVKSLVKLRAMGLIKDVSFDGRNRIMRACIGEYVEKCQSQAASDLNPKQGVIKITGSVGFLSHPSYIESKEESKEEITPPIPPHLEEDNATKVAEKKDKFSAPHEVKETSDAMVQTLKEEKPNYKAPSNLSQWNVSIDQMIRLDGRTPEQIIRLFRWAVADTFWQAHMFKPNPAKYLREKFDQLEMKMNAKPSKGSKVDRRTRNMDGSPVETPHLDDLF